MKQTLTPGGPEWNFQLQITPVIPRLVNRSLLR
jgi:hypothetical protein